MSGAGRPAAIGMALAVAAAAGFELAGSPWNVLLFALFLAFTACVYPGAALALDHAGRLRLETVVGLAVLASSALGVVHDSWWLVGGYLAHGAWDVLHHRGVARTRTAAWFPPTCASFDFVIGLWIAWAHALPR